MQFMFFVQNKILRYDTLLLKYAKYLTLGRLSPGNLIVGNIIFTLFFISANCSSQTKQKANYVKAAKLSVKSDYKNYYIRARLAPGEISYQPEVDNSISDTSIEVSARSLDLILESKKNVYLNLNKIPHFELLSISINRVDTININEAISKNIFIKNIFNAGYQSAKTGTVVISNSGIERLDISNFTAENFIIKNSSINYLNFNKTLIVGRFSITTCSLDSINFEYAGLPDTLFFTNLDLRKIRHEVDLTTAYNPASSDMKSVLVFANTDLNRFKIPLDRFTISISKMQSYERQVMLYQQLLKLLENAGLTEKYEEYDKEFKEIKLLHNNSSFINWLSKIWWDYGYNKEKVILNSIIIFSIFFVLNLLFFQLLIMIYYPIKFKEYRDRFTAEYHRNRNGIKYILAHLFHVFLYTSYLFWGLKLDLKEIEIKFSFIIFLIIAQYISGVVCIAYIANFIITK